MNAETFVPTEVSCWLSRGRTPEHASALAAVWRDFPDLATSAPLEDRMARGRARIAAMKPVNDAIAAETERNRQARNFAFIETKADDGEIDDRDLAILRGRDLHGYDWDAAVRYADGWYAAHAGWPHRSPSDAARHPACAQAYDNGFADGGGNPADLFDAARRSNLAALRHDNQRAGPLAVAPGRPLPSSWPKPSDHARPTRWSQRLLILADIDTVSPSDTRGRSASRSFFAEALDRAGADTATVIVLDRHAGFVTPDCMSNGISRPLTRSDADALIAGNGRGDALRRLIEGRDFSDVLTTMQGYYLRVLDAAADALPLCRTMERTRNTPLQQRGHLRCWLDRGFAGADNVGAGHIRWGKAIKGLTGKLGEFTARYAGPAPTRGHLIRVEIEGGRPASGFATSAGAPLPFEITVPNKSHLRRDMAAALRSFGGATRLMDIAA